MGAALVGLVVTIIIIYSLIQVFKFKDTQFQLPAKKKEDDFEDNISMMDFNAGKQPRQPVSFSTIGFGMDKSRKD